MAAAAAGAGSEAVSLVSVEDLTAFCRECLVSAGSNADNARTVAEVLVEADVRGITSHGVNRLELYCDELKRESVDGAGKPVLESDAISVALVNGNNAQGAVVGKFAMGVAMRKAKETGIGWVCARNTNHYGIAGFYARMAAEQQMVGLSFTNTSPVAVPTRSKVAAIGTNPIGCAGPTKGKPVVIDMATPTVPLGRIEVYHRKGLTCPEGWGVDAEGQPTTDPAKILFGGGLSPLGSESTSGHKGYCLGFLVEMMCGVMAGANFGRRIGMTLNPNAKSRKTAVNLGQCFVAIDPDKFVPGYADRLQEFVDQMHGLETADGAAGPVLVPGEPEDAATEKSHAEGIAIHAAVGEALVRVAKEFGVELPKALQHLQPAAE